MENKPKPKYGQTTATCMVVGVVIGSGVFFKAEAINSAVGGSLVLGTIAWLCGGLIMISCALMFAVIASECESSNGLVGYADKTVGKKYAFFVGWFMATVYYPSLAAVLSWLSAKYTLALFGYYDSASNLCFLISGAFLALSFFVNVVSPRLTGRFQVFSTVAKLVPLILMAVAGTVKFVFSPTSNAGFTFPLASAGSLPKAVVSAAFAYEGWIVATSISAELKNPKRALPRALAAGSLTVVAVYVFYYVGLLGQCQNSAVDVGLAFSNLFGPRAAVILSLFVAISCMGALNGVMFGCARGMYSLATQGYAALPKSFSRLNKKTDAPPVSAVTGLVLSAVWFFYFYGSHTNQSHIFSYFYFDISELPVITLYGMYVPIFVSFMIKSKKTHIFKRYVLPAASIFLSLVMVGFTVFSHGISPYLEAKKSGAFSLPILTYFVVFACVMILGAWFYKKQK